jgi:hypothetical protein
MSLFCDNGYCPQCEGEEKQISMQLNSDDFWECPNCQLQILGMVPVFSIILPWRGEGEFRDNVGDPQSLHDTIVMGYIEAPDNCFDADTDKFLNTREMILDYIETHVFKNKNKYNLHKFLES